MGWPFGQPIDHDSDHQSDPTIPDLYKVALSNNEVLRLVSASGAAPFPDHQRDPTPHQATKPHRFAMEPATPLQTAQDAQEADNNGPERAPV